MARYRKIEVATWTDERFMELSSAPANAQTLWLYLLTGQRTTSFPGLVIGREEVMASDLGWSVDDFRRVAREVTQPRSLPGSLPGRMPPTFPEGSAKPLAKADWKVGLVVLSKALIDSSGEPRDTARPTSPNVIRSWAKSWDEVPECYLKYEYLQTLGSFSKGLGKAFAEAFAEAFRKALAKPSPHPSPIQDAGTEAEAGTEGSGLSSPPKAGTTKGSKVKLVPPSEAVSAAARLMTRIIANNPGSTTAKAPEAKRQATVLRWADAMRLLHEVDGHSWDDIDKQIDWCQSDQFWKSNILSGDKLREKWDQLDARRRQPIRSAAHGGGETLDYLRDIAEGVVP